MLLRYKMAYKNYNLLNIFNKYILFVLNNLNHLYIYIYIYSDNEIHTLLQ